VHAIHPAPAYVLAALILAALSGCNPQAAIRIQADHSPTVNWSTYRTYAWRSAALATGRAPRDQREILDWRIRNQVETQLAAKGYVQTPSSRPDFLIDYRIEEKEKNTDSIGDYIRYRQSGGEAGPSEAYVFGYQEGSLILEIIDAQTQQLVWRASASAVVTSDQSDAKLKEAVQAMLQQFPPP